MTTETIALPRLTEVAPPGAANGTLTLPFGDRRRSRLRARLDDGREVALLLPRGTELRDGDRLSDASGAFTVAVRAAEETLSWARAEDHLLLARAAYHLGNRHVPVQIGAGWLAYQHDHVLDGMIVEMGLAVETRRASFEPESGGYRHGGGAAAHGGHHHEH
ncbi:MAG TPA: urease accessory protein UreE [Polyangia bacterium]|nr:urease accessory protein UreE [Polyangia bacterium]